MKKTSNRVSKELKDEILKRIKEEGISVSQAAKDYGLCTNTIYRWLTKGVSESISFSEYNKLKKENEELKKFIGEITVELSRSKKKN